jgi:hypothetical protein
MLKIVFHLVFTLTTILLFPAVMLAQPTVSGDLFGTLGPGSFVVEGDCNVPTAETLTILPGTTLLFSGHYTFYVYGQLIAEGTETDSIYFVRQYPTEECKHGGIRFQVGSSTDNRMSYCWVDYAFNPQFPTCFGGGIFCEGAGISIANCQVTNCKALFGGGIYIIDSEATVTHCVISGCEAIAEGAPLYAAFSSVLVSDCEVTGNTGDHVGGLYIYTCDEAEVRNCVVAFNIATTTAG